MNDLLLITDIPRVRKIFSRLSDDKTKLRIANSLEKGGEELASQKPTIVFVQTHLSGLSPEIIYMHLKKQLGRKRTRFVLLAKPEQVSPESTHNYHATVDIAQNDDIMLLALKTVMSSILPKSSVKSSEKISEEKPDMTPENIQIHEAKSNADLKQASEFNNISLLQDSSCSTAPSSVHSDISIITPLALSELESLAEKEDEQKPVATQVHSENINEVEKGIAYPIPTKLSVYSDFTNSFDSAVDTMEKPEKVIETISQHTLWEEASSSEKPKLVRSFIVWLAPLLLLVVAVTFWQQKRKNPANTPPKSVVASPVSISANTVSNNIFPNVPAQVENVKTTASQLEKTEKVSTLKTPTATTINVKSSRLTTLPDFIPRYGYDKKYAKEHPGWERYNGQVTEFKILRDDAGIKAIQVLDHGGNGVPESFMRGVMRQLVKNQSFVQTADEEKDGYRIVRGAISPYQDVVYYRDTDAGKLRGFVVTWR